MTDLTSVLETATEHIEPRGLAAAALTEARRRRARRRALVSAASATAVVAAVVFAADVVGGSDKDTPGPQVRPSTPTSHSTPEPTKESTPPDLPTGVVQPTWDPRRVDELPAATGEFPLPDVIAPPTSATLLSDSPISSAVLSMDRGNVVQVMAADGTWRGVPVPDESAPAPSLAPGGTRLAVPTLNGVDVWDIPSGTYESFGLPAGFEPWDYQTVKWVNDQTLLLDDLAAGWLLDLATGTSTRVPYPTESTWTLDESGSLVESAGVGTGLSLTDWASGEPRKVPMTGTGSLYRLVASPDSIVGVSYSESPIDGFGVIAADRDDLTPRAVLPVKDHDANYSNWALGPVLLRDDGIVVLWTAIPGHADVDGWRLVSWDTGSGDLSILARTDANPTWGVSFARDLLR